MRARSASRVHVLHVRGRVLHVCAHVSPRPTAVSRRSFWFLPTRSQHALAPTTAQGHPDALQRHRQVSFGGMPATTVRPYHGRCCLSHSGAPAAPWNSPNLSTSPSASARRLHVALLQQNGGSPTSLSPAAAEQTSNAYIREP